MYSKYPSVVGAEFWAVVCFFSDYILTASDGEDENYKISTQNKYAKDSRNNDDLLATEGTTETTQIFIFPCFELFLTHTSLQAYFSFQNREYRSLLVV